MDTGTRALERSDENQQIAAQLRETSDLLRSQGANPFRVGAYRRAADTIAQLDRPLREVFDAKGRAGLQALPGIGSGIASAIAEMLVTGSWSQLARLRGSSDPEALFRTVPGIGEELAHALHRVLQVDTLEELENAAHDGRLEAVRGVGARRAAAIRASLASMLGRRVGRAPHLPMPELPDVAILLDVDGEYRGKAAARKLPTIAPKRFNPEGIAWLPVLHTARHLAFHRALFEHGALARARQDARLGRHLLLRRRPPGAPVHGGHRDPRRACGQSRGAGPRGRMPRNQSTEVSMNVGELCNREVIFAYRDTRLVEAARLMREHHVGSLVVVVDRLSERVPVGILTDRDIVVAVVAKELDPRTLTAGEVMSRELSSVREEDGLPTRCA